MEDRTIIVASNNEGKINEIKAILPEYIVLSLKEAGIKSNPDETESTFEGNAMLKAKDAKRYTKHMVIADDSGLQVHSLNNIPGVFSKRFYFYTNSNSNKKSTINVKGKVLDKKNTKSLINLMKNVKEKNRSASFVSVIALIEKDGTKKIFSGICEGRITMENKGNRGFGYDPVFIPNGYNITFAEMSDDEKNKISHRANALKKLKEYLND